MRKKKNICFALLPGAALFFTPVNVFAAEQSMGEKMSAAVQNTILGIGTVFIMLIIISLIIYCFRFIPKLTERSGQSKQQKSDSRRADAAEKQETADDVTSDILRSRAEVPAGNKSDPVTEPAPMISGSADGSDIIDPELVAVIAAAIAASEQIPLDGFVVRTIRKRKSFI
ncbi:MAG: OadG family protein [Clostridiales bacterium]|nr:OadG family protein [Clostridiales bacterium]